MLILLLEHLLPAALWRVLAEFPLTRESRRIDAVIVRRLAELGAWRPEYLRSVLDDLCEHNIVHFKGATDALERADALQVLSYAFQYMALHDIHDPAQLSLRVVAPTLTPRFREQVLALGGTLTETAMAGVYEGTLGGFALRVVETSVVWPHPHEHLLYAVSPACLERPRCPSPLDDRELELYYRLMQNVTQLVRNATWKTIMKDANLVESAASKALLELLASIPVELRLSGLKPEERLSGLKPEERLSGLKPEDVLTRFKPEERLVGLKPEERLVGLTPATIAHALKPEDRLVDLTPAQAVLALPDALLRGLSAEYIATLPDDVQRTVRERLAR